MQIRARDVLSSLAAVGIGGAIGSILGTPRRRHARGTERVEPSTATAVEDAVIVMEAELPPVPYDEELASDAVIVDEPILAATDDDGYNVRPESDLITAGIANDAHAPGGQIDPEDDPPNGEHPFESLMTETVETTPADQPLTLDDDADEPILLEHRLPPGSRRP